MDEGRTEFIIVRHGQTEWNLEGRYQGHHDSRLTELGRAQAHAAGRRLTQYDIDRLISSDLGRAMQTTERICSHTGHKPIFDSRLREVNMGILENNTRETALKNHFEVFNEYISLDPDYVVPEGESRRQFYDRVINFFTMLNINQSGRTTAIVTHGGVLRNLFRFINDIALDEPFPAKMQNAAISFISVEDGEWILDAWNDVTHLKGLD